MSTKRVVLLSNHSLLASGVRRLLQEVEGLELSMVTAAGQEALPMLKNLAPDVIVLDSGDPSLGEGVITHLLGQHPRAKVIALDLNRTGIEVYRVKCVLQADFNGLLQAISGKGASPKRGAAQKREMAKQKTQSTRRQEDAPMNAIQHRQETQSRGTREKGNVDA